MTEVKSLREVLHRADPGLKIISGAGHHQHGYRSGDQDWDNAAGVICNSCGREVFRSRDGLCMQCWESSNELVIVDRTGITEFLPQTVIMEICKKPNYT